MGLRVLSEIITPRPWGCRSLASLCPSSHFPVQGAVCVRGVLHAFMCGMHNMCRCEGVLYLYQLLPVITHWCAAAGQNGPATFHHSTANMSADTFKSRRNVALYAPLFAPLHPFSSHPARRFYTPNFSSYSLPSVTPAGLLGGSSFLHIKLAWALHMFLRCSSFKI